MKPTDGKPSPIDTEAQERFELAAQEAREREFLIEVRDVQWLMSHGRGRRFVFRLFDKAGLNRDPFDTNAMQQSRNLGERAFAYALFRIVDRYCRRDYALMMQENAGWEKQQ